MIDNYFQNIRTVSEDGLHVIGALALGSPSFFDSVFDKAYQYCEFALSQTPSEPEFKGAFLLIADMTKSNPNRMLQHLPKMATFIENTIQSQTISRNIKMPAYQLLGDLSLGLGQHIAPYLESFMNLLNIGSMAVLDLGNSNEIDNIEYSDQLKEKLVEGYICVLHSITDYKRDQIFRNSINGIMSFLDQTTNIRVNPTIDYIRTSLHLILDIVSIYTGDTVQYLNSNCTQNLITHLGRFSHDENNSNAILYYQNTKNKFGV